VIYGLAAYYGQEGFKSASTPLAIALIAAAALLVFVFVRFIRHNAKRLYAEAERAFPPSE
jgi:hypothetical protein